MLRKLALGVVALPALGYLGLCGFLYAKQRELMYFPQDTRIDAMQTNYKLVREGTTLHGWVVNPERQNAILYFGGNAERIENNRDEFARWFPESSVYLMAYRGYGANLGTPDEQTLCADAVALFDQVQSQHPGGHVSVIGRSLGSGVASHVAAKRPVMKLALITPFDSMAHTAQVHYPWMPVRWLTRDRYDSVQHLTGYARPVLVVRAGQDRVIPAANTNRLIAALPKPEVLDLPEAEHGTIHDYPLYGETLAAFLK